MPSTPDAARRAGICAVLALATLVAYWPVLGHDFVNYDDETYVTDNPHVTPGLTLDGLRWAFTTGHASNWHPLTWLSHMLDCEIFGLDPRGHHLTSLVLHLLNTLLWFLLWDRMTGASWRSGFVAALFALHPLHVESVAWVAERKDVLSTLFLLLTVDAYVRYVSRPTAGRYVPVFVLLAFGLAAKPMLVTLPLLLLLLDAWPLGRVEGTGWRRLVVEKLPLVGLAAVSGGVTLAVQRAGGALDAFEAYPLGVRAANAAVSYVGYLWNTFWPRDLTVFYPHPGVSPPGWQVWGALAVLAGATAFALRVRRTHPYAIVGWAWYVATLLPVIGLVQVGRQAMADRYTYVPLVGVFVVVAWGVPELFGRVWARRAAAGDRVARARGSLAPRGPAVAAAALVVVLAALTRAQLGTWRNSIALFEHAVEVAESAVAHNNLANALSEAGRADEALEHYRAAGRLDPRDADVQFNLAVALMERNEVDAALRHLRDAVEIRPDYHQAHYNLGTLLAARRQWPDAIAHLSRAVEIRPDFGAAHANLAAALYVRGEYAQAWKHVRLAGRHGSPAPARLLELLREKMPEPDVP